MGHDEVKIIAGKQKKRNTIKGIIDIDLFTLWGMLVGWSVGRLLRMLYVCRLPYSTILYIGSFHQANLFAHRTAIICEWNPFPLYLCALHTSIFHFVCFVCGYIGMAFVIPIKLLLFISLSIISIRFSKRWTLMPLYHIHQFNQTSLDQLRVINFSNNLILWMLLIHKYWLNWHIFCSRKRVICKHFN